MLEELKTIDLLKRLFTTAPSILPNGVADPGWNCLEHSYVASIALRLCGLDAHKCEGQALYYDPVRKLKTTITPHNFVVVDWPPARIFDSSIVMGEVIGVTSCTANASIIKCSSEALDPISDHIYYIPEHFGHFSAAMFNWRSDTPFGQWFSGYFGDQNGIWERVVWEAYLTLIGDGFVGSELRGRELWERIIELPSRKDEMLRMLELA